MHIAIAQEDGSGQEWLLGMNSGCSTPCAGGHTHYRVVMCIPVAANLVHSGGGGAHVNICMSLLKQEVPRHFTAFGWVSVMSCKYMHPCLYTGYLVAL
jgi:hypothetical protein